MKFHLSVLALAVAVLALVAAGCVTAPSFSAGKKMVRVTGRIVVNDGGVIQKTGLAPVWIYDAANGSLTTQLPLPDFGGRGRKDWQRIVKDYPNALRIYSDCEATQRKASEAETKYQDLNEEYWDKRQELHGQTNGLDYEEVRRLDVAVKEAAVARDAAWDEHDDFRELVVLWNNINPGVLYAGLPAPVAKVHTDKNGAFNVTLPAGKKVLVATHIEAPVDGDPGCYFWLLPFDTGNAATNSVALNGNNIRCKNARTALREVVLLQTNEAINSGLWMLNRIRDARQ